MSYPNKNLNVTFKYDTVMGEFKGDVIYDGDLLTINYNGKKNIIKTLSRTQFLFSQIFDLEEKIKERPGIIKKIF